MQANGQPVLACHDGEFISPALFELDAKHIGVETVGSVHVGNENRDHEGHLQQPIGSSIHPKSFCCGGELRGEPTDKPSFRASHVAVPFPFTLSRFHFCPRNEYSSHSRQWPKSRSHPSPAQRTSSSTPCCCFSLKLRRL